MKKISLLAFSFLILLNFIFALSISEFIVSLTGSEAVEIYNSSASAIELSNYKLIVSGYNWADTSLALPSYSLAPGEYKSYAATEIWTSTIPNEGGAIEIIDASNNMVDYVAYGNKGPAPAPICNFSTARVAFIGGNAVEYNMDFTPTMGSANNCPVNALGEGTVFINEIYADTGAPVQFIELYNSSSTGVDITNWVIVVDDDYYIPSTVIPGKGYFVLYESSFPLYFYMDMKYENCYLYNDSRQRVDQVGWDPIPLGQSFSVRPNGIRTAFDGFNNATSVDFEYYEPTPAAANPVLETRNFSDNEKSIDVISIPRVGFSISSPLNGSMKIMDVSGRIIYTSNIKNMIFSAKSGIYFIEFSVDNERILKRTLILK